MMRKIIVSEFITLDGIVEAPDKWSLPYWDDEIAKFKFDELFSADALLLGRVTYEGFAAAWPTMTDEEGFADRMNSLPKFVVSTTLEKAEWNNSTIIKDNIIEEISKLKSEPSFAEASFYAKASKDRSGQDILINGSAKLVNTLVQHDLVDEYRLLVYPIVLGSGKRLFKDGSKANLKLVETREFSTGVVLLRYEPV